MFDQLGNKIQSTFRKLTGKGKLSEKDINDALREIRMALLEADVNYKVAVAFLSDIKQRALSEEVLSSLTPGQQVIRIVNEELTKLLGGSSKDINVTASPTVVLLAGVQGSGKTTSAAKLARYFMDKNKRVMLAACDTQRAAAVDQLKILAQKLGASFYHESDMTPPEIAKSALKAAVKDVFDVLIVDTAGRQHVDEALMDEIEEIYQAVRAQEVLFVVDCMMGQQAVDAASAFDERVHITGFILSKADSDARGGAALSVSYITKKPVKFTGTGEKIEDFSLFHPDRIASRILGMGDVISLIEKAQRVSDEEEQLNLLKKMKKNAFDLEDYLTQLEQIQNMGGFEEVLSSLPIPKSKMGPMNVDEKEFIKMKAVIQSMTLKERRSPAIINGARRKRIAAGSGTTVTDVNRLLKSFEQSKKMMKSFSGGKMKNKRLGGGMGFPF